MKQSYAVNLFFGFFLMIYSLDISSKYTMDFDSFLFTKKYYQVFNKQYYDDDYDEEDINVSDDCLDQVFAVLVSLYRKIVTAVISHYIMVSIVPEYDLEEKIARIIIDDVAKIMKIIGRKIITSTAHPQVSVKKKIYYMVILVSAIIVIRNFISYVYVSEKQSTSLAKDL